ncbi:hypothetical protein [Mycobacteroides chelonae]|uniref:hypothetical protein n=1 Tax=Mycobacteroides chelonae TaxID=1774 RepID=UPI0008AA285F|nr:hypothetical protein [Mycobacteroides chelonae]AYM42044.1 hypothetical protein DYE20_11195 [[Mycobacterium] chelonae subsp. gwanakae]OHU17081.1 hypothetical protein BKG75_00210 [Mycobacteroides chelonae]
MQHQEIAPARIITTHCDRRDGTRSVAIECPFCVNKRTGRSGVHIHGWPLDEESPGVRQAHCADGSAQGRSYRLVLDEETSA